MVIVTDGNREHRQRDGAGPAKWPKLASGIDVVPVRYQARSPTWRSSESRIPPDVNRGQPFDVRVVLNNSAVATDQKRWHH